MATTSKKTQNRYRVMRSAVLTGSILSVLPLVAVMKSAASVDGGPSESAVAAAPASTAASGVIAAAPTQAQTSNVAATPTAKATATTSSTSTTSSQTTYTRTKAS